MEDEGLNGKVAKLGIVAHGDSPGQVQLNELLTPDSVDDFGSALHRMRWFLHREAYVIFYSPGHSSPRHHCEGWYYTGAPSGP